MGDREVSLDDLELVAALIDGRLAGGEREQAMARVVADPALYEVFVQASEATDIADDTHTPVGRAEALRTGRPWRTWIPIAAAAAVTLVLGLRLGGFFDPAAVPDTSSEIAASLDAAALDDAWATHGWSIARGSDEGAGGEARASARAGVLLVDLAVAWRRGDDPRVAATAAALDRIADRLPLGSALAAPLQPFLDPSGVICVPEPCGTPPRSAPPALAALDAAVGAAADPDALELGRWAEAVRLAARTGAVGITAGWLDHPPAGWQRALAQLGIDRAGAATPLGIPAERFAVEGLAEVDLDRVARAAGELISRF
jgi:hypothetical protein